MAANQGDHVVPVPFGTLFQITFCCGTENENGSRPVLENTGMKYWKLRSARLISSGPPATVLSGGMPVLPPPWARATEMHVKAMNAYANTEVRRMDSSERL